MDDMTIAAYDVEVLREQQREAERRHARALARWRYSAMAVGYVAAAAAVVAVVWIIWQGVAGPSATEQFEDRQKIACIEAGGSWLRVGDPDRGNEYGTCFGKEESP
jgi:hypothetical protein